MQLQTIENEIIQHENNYIKQLGTEEMEKKGNFKARCWKLHEKIKLILPKRQDSNIREELLNIERKLINLWNLILSSNSYHFEKIESELIGLENELENVKIVKKGGEHL